MLAPCQSTNLLQTRTTLSVCFPLPTPTHSPHMCDRLCVCMCVCLCFSFAFSISNVFPTPFSLLVIHPWIFRSGIFLFLFSVRKNVRYAIVRAVCRKAFIHGMFVCILLPFSILLSIYLRCLALTRTSDMRSSFTFGISKHSKATQKCERKENTSPV